MADVKTPRCDLTELPADGCAHCRNIPDPTATGRNVTRHPDARTITTRWAGRCGSCDTAYYEGDRIHGVTGSWLGPCCAPTEAS